MPITTVCYRLMSDMDGAQTKLYLLCVEVDMLFILLCVENRLFNVVQLTIWINTRILGLKMFFKNADLSPIFTWPAPIKCLFAIWSVTATMWQ